MANYSKKRKALSDDGGILVKVGVLEKLVDRLIDRVADLEVTVKGHTKIHEDIVKAMQTLAANPVDDWDIQEGEKTEATEKDDLSSILSA